jgi:soluble cytochrome b562
MQISAVSSRPSAAMQGSGGFAKVKQSFQQLGKALDAGNLDEAQKALAQLQANAPAQAKNDNNPMSAKIEALSKAVESGDLEAAKEAYTDIKKTMSQRPTGGGGRAGGAGGPPPGGGAPPSGAGKSSESSGSSDSSKVYDPEDTNKDGTVSWKEEQDYKLNHPDKADRTSTAYQLDALA